MSRDLADGSSMTELIDAMLDELGDGPEPLQPVPEELQPMLERIQRMADEEPQPPYRPPDLQCGTDPAPYAQVYQTISELCQIMTPGAPTYPEAPGMSGTSAPQPDVGLMYQPSTSYGGYRSDPPPLPHLQTPERLSPLVPLAPPVPLAPLVPVAPGQASTPTLRELLSPHKPRPPLESPQPKGDNPRELRNQAEKQRRNKLKESISLLATIVPPVIAIQRKTDKTNIMRLSAHYLRSHQYVFGDSIKYGKDQFKASSMKAVLSMFKGFLLTVTYKGIVVVVSHNVHQFLGYSELELIGTNVFAVVHPEDHRMLHERLSPPPHLIGKHGELLIPDEPGAEYNVAKLLSKERRTFMIRFKMHGHRSEPPRYLTCHMEGFFRKSDKATRHSGQGRQVVRRARARADNPRSSGNDVVFVGIVRPVAEGYKAEGIVESFRMEYRTRHSVDGEIIQCEQRIALVTGYTTQEVHGINAMNFMHRDDVNWVIIALREMYDQQRLFGESCYRLMMKNGEFVYMRTRGTLDVDEHSKIATTFVCTNTVVGEEEGKYLIEQMRKRFTINNDVDNLLFEGPIPDVDIRDLQLNELPEEIEEVLSPNWVSNLVIQPPDYIDFNCEEPVSCKRPRLDPELGEPSTSYHVEAPQPSPLAPFPTPKGKGRGKRSTR